MERRRYLPLIGLGLAGLVAVPYATRSTAPVEPGRLAERVFSTAIDDAVGREIGKAPAHASTVRGRVRYVLRDEHGAVRYDREIGNLVVNAGMAGIASRINGSGGEAAFAWIAIGTGVSGPAAGDTTLGTEIASGGGSRAACTTSRVTTDVTNDTAQCQVTFAFTASFAVTESGYFNAASTGTMAARQVFAAINVVNGDSLQVTWKLDVD